MKYVIVLGDGMADYKIASLNDKTPLMAAKKPNIDSLAKVSEVGLCYTIPLGMAPGSDTANLSVLGYDPKHYYTGRSPLEAASIGIDLKPTDITLRANLVTLSNEPNYEDKTMLDYSAGEISTEEAKELILFLSKYINNEYLKLYNGVSYRHCLVISDGWFGNTLTPPHDISSKPIKTHLPKGESANLYLDIMKKSAELLKNHPINLKRLKEGKNPANSLWLWGEGTKPNLDLFYDKFGKKGGMISAVDLLKGIGKLAGMKVIPVVGATGNYETNFSGKAEAALRALKGGLDFVYIHIEAPDECGHQGDIKHKVYAIEQIDEKVVKPLLDGLKAMDEDFAMLILPDHPTPISLRTHVNKPVPYLLYNSTKKFPSLASAYDEFEAEKTAIVEKVGHDLIKRLFAQK